MIFSVFLFGALDHIPLHWYIFEGLFEPVDKYICGALVSVYISRTVETEILNHCLLEKISFTWVQRFVVSDCCLFSGKFSSVKNKAHEFNSSAATG